MHVSKTKIVQLKQMTCVSFWSVRRLRPGSNASGLFLSIASITSPSHEKKSLISLRVPDQAYNNDLSLQILGTNMVIWVTSLIEETSHAGMVWLRRSFRNFAVSTITHQFQCIFTVVPRLLNRYHCAV